MDIPAIRRLFPVTRQVAYLNNAAQSALAKPVRERHRNARAGLRVRGDEEMCGQNALRPAIAEVYQGSFLVSWHVIGTEPTTLQISLPGNLPLLQQIAKKCRLPSDARLARILHPWRPPVRLLEIEGECEPPHPEQAPRQPGIPAHLVEIQRRGVSKQQQR